MGHDLKYKLKNCIRGLIYGQALGDACGLQTEFKYKKDKHEVKFPYTEKIRNFPICDWTDDTDQMILLLETIIESNCNFKDDIFSETEIKLFAKKLISWKNHGFIELGDNQGLGVGGTTSLVLNHQNFLDNPIEVSKEIWVNSGKKLAANGAIMRTSILSIINLFTFLNDPIIDPNFYKSVRNMCLVTHHDVRCIISCFILNHLIREIIYHKINSKKISENIKKNTFKTALQLIKTINVNHYPTTKVVTGVRHQPTPKIFTEDKFYNNDKYLVENELLYYFTLNLESLKLDEIGKIGYTYKCLGCVLWILDIISSFEKNKNIDKNIDKKLSFEKIIKILCEECGDADTNAACAGALLGAYLGYDDLPKTWLDALPNKKWLDNKIDLLFIKMNI